MAFTDIKYISRKYAAEIEAWRQLPVQKSWDWIARRVSELESIPLEAQPSGNGIRRHWLSLCKKVDYSGVSNHGFH